MLTSRGRLVVALAPVLYIVAWAAGSRALYPVAVGLALAAGVAWTWVFLLRGPLELHRATRGTEQYEGDDVDVGLELVPERSPAPSSAVVVDRVGRAGVVEAAVERQGKRLRGRYRLERLPRGRYAYLDSHAVIEDPFGLARATVPLRAAGSLLVYPRLVELDGLFTESGADLHDGRRVLLRRATGFDLHSVREYQPGESLRRVHWRSTAHRGRLMVKELEDEPRDEVAVLLDTAASAVVGSPPDSSFDLQVRAAGSLLRAHARRGRRVLLSIAGASRDEQRVDGGDADWLRALELLASVEPARDVPAASLASDEGAAAAARALELVIVTARLAPDLVERLGQRALSGGAVALVYVHAPSFAGGRAPVREPALLRLQALGIPVAVLRRGDDLQGALGAVSLQREAAGA
ncbi:MAG: DUF58 domain-containing protein [Thermoleophilia bacterium]|nr:DUF58 domain-containing protein [Thermoleophilia bacterium]